MDGDYLQSLGRRASRRGSSPDKIDRDIGIETRAGTARGALADSLDAQRAEHHLPHGRHRARQIKMSARQPVL